MAKITYIEFSGTERVIDAMPGLSVMRGAATDNDVRGIIAGTCGGACSLRNLSCVRRSGLGR